MQVDRRSLLSAAGLALAVAPTPGLARSQGRRSGAVDLRAAQRTTPLGVDDPAPSLSWKIAGETMVQTSWRILVASSPERLATGEGDLWDSGRQRNGAQVAVYAGRPLSAVQRVFWTVRTWDQHDRLVPGEQSWFETGLIDPANWRGDWIAAESPQEREDREAGAVWVTASAGPEAGPRRFRLVFESAAGQSILTIVADGTLSDVNLDGVPLDLAPRNPNAFGGRPADRFVLDVGAGAHRLEATVRPTPGYVVKTAVALASHLRLVGASRLSHVSGGWEVEALDGGSWSAAAPQATQPDFPWPPTPARLMRRGFVLPNGARRARLHVAALGGYELFLNGRAVTEDLLQSEPADYRKTIPYRTHDVTALLRAGENVLGAVIGDGWYASYIAPSGRYAFGGAPRRLRLMLEVVDQSGQAHLFTTDGGWKSATAPIRSSELYDGEVFDAAFDHSGWAQPGFDDTDWDGTWTAPTPAGRPVSRLGQPIRQTRTLSPRAIKPLGQNRFLIDFGQNFAGRVRLRLDGTTGQEIVVTHAELLGEDGLPDRRNLRAAQARAVYRLGGGAARLEPRFTYHGFRYALVEGVSRLEARDVEGVVIGSDLPETGRFEIDQPVIQALWHNVLWSQRSNFVGLPTDCPQRDERLGWTGDAQVFWDTAAHTMDVAAFTRVFMDDLRDAQGPKGGFPLWAPVADGLGWGTPSPTPGWADAGVMLPYVAYLHSGDRRLIDENWAAMHAYVSGVLSGNPDGLWANERGADLGDWLSLDARHPFDETTPKTLVATAMLARSVAQLAEMAVWTGREAEAEALRVELGRIDAAFARAFVDGEGRVGNESHTSYVLGLRLGLVPPALRRKAADRFAAGVRDRGGLLTTGFLGAPLALDALADHGHADLAWDLLLRTEYPSWGYMVMRGATTIWERWNGDVGDVAMNSYNHYALGAVAAFLYRRVAGIEPLVPGYGAVRIAPLVDARVGSAGAVYDSARGPISSHWRFEHPGRLTLEVVLPANTNGRVVLPGSRMSGPAGTPEPSGREIVAIGPGRHRFVVDVREHRAAETRV